MEPIIKVSDLVKRYKKADKNAVDDISFEVKAGEFFAFLGPNGAGKTTTISILTTTLAKSSGEVTIAGFDLEREANKVRRNVGIIFQNPSLDLNLTAEENIRFHALLYGLYPYRPTYSLMPQKYKDQVSDLAEILDIQDQLFKPVKTFSGGMKRKMEIIRSLTHKPKVLFLDEPTSGLDPLSRKSLWDYLQKIKKEENMTIFLTTHYLEEAEGADNVAIVNQGKIITTGTPAEIKRQLVQEYVEVDTEKREKLIAELKRKKLKHVVGEHVKVYLGKKNAQRVIQQIKTEVNFLAIHMPTLEDAYLEIIGGVNGSRN